MNTQELATLKVEDFLYLSEKRWEALKKEIFESIEKLNILTSTYESVSDLVTLEELKREFNSNLGYLGTLYAITKTYKGSNHTYLETALKQLKARTIELMLTEKSKNITSAEKMYYIHPNYVEKLQKINKLMKFFIEVEIKYERFSGTLQCVIQSVSVARGDFNNTKGD